MYTNKIIADNMLSAKSVLLIKAANIIINSRLQCRGCEGTNKIFHFSRNINVDEDILPACFFIPVLDSIQTIL